LYDTRRDTVLPRKDASTDKMFDNLMIDVEEQKEKAEDEPEENIED